MTLLARAAGALTLALVLTGLLAPMASATPVCTNGYMGGLPLEACGGRVFPEADRSVEYIQLSPNPLGFREFQHGMEYLAQEFPRWVSITTLSGLYGEDAVSAGPDQVRANADGDSGDGREIYLIKVTDHDLPDEGKETLLFSLSVHGDEKGGLEGGARVVEDLARGAEGGGTLTDGIPGYESATGVDPQFHSYEISELLANEAVYFIAFNADGWAAGEPGAGGALYTRGNSIGTDLNRQMPTVGYINPGRNPLQEQEMHYGLQAMQDVAAAGVGGLMAYGADIHGEGQSRAFADIMYPAGQFDSLKHRQLMAIAERTKSEIDATLYAGLIDFVEEQTGGDLGEGIEDYGAPANTIPTKPARWGTVWDTLGYTDTGFIGDYLAGELGVTGMDYEIALNHSDVRAYGRPWSILLQENYINATREIVGTAMAYAMYQDEEFADFRIDTGGGSVGYLFTDEVVTDADGVGNPGGPAGDGIGADGLPIEQRPYAATQLRFFDDEAAYLEGGFAQVLPADIAASRGALDHLDTLVLADLLAPADALGRPYDEAAYWATLRGWVERGGNLVLTDRALHALEELDVVPAGSVSEVAVYQPYADFVDRAHPLAAGLRGNARQLAEFTLIGYGIGNSASPMSVVASAAFEGAGGHTVGTTGTDRVSVGEVAVGAGRIRILGGGLHTPSEDLDHRYGLKDYALTYSGLFVLENALVHDAPGLGSEPAEPPPAVQGNVLPLLLFAPVPLAAFARRRRAVV